MKCHKQSTAAAAAAAVATAATFLLRAVKSPALTIYKGLLFGYLV